MNRKVEEKLFRVERARLDLRSLLMLFAFAGFFGGIVLGVISGFIYMSKGEYAVAIASVLLSPFATSFNAVVIGLAGYPIYSYACNRFLSQSISGREGLAAPSDG